MFQLTDRARRKITIALFFVLCLVPTGVLLALGLWRHRPGSVACEANRLSRRCGLTVKLGDVEHLRPGVTVYRDVELCDPETGEPLLRLGRLKAGPVAPDEAEGAAADGCLLEGSEVEVHEAKLDDLCRFIGRLLERRTGWPEINLRLAAEEVVLVSDETRLVFEQVFGRLASSEQGVQGSVSFCPAGSSAGDPVRIRVVRNGTSGPVTAQLEAAAAVKPATLVELYTGERFLWTSMLGIEVEAFKKLGPDAQFCGYIRMQETADGWEGDLRGQLFGVELDRLVSDRFKHRLSGRARLLLEEVRFRDGRLIEAVGSVEGGPGLVGRSLLEAATSRLGLTGSRGFVSDDVVPYETLAVSFYLNAGGLRLRGDCRSGPAGSIMTGRHGELLVWPSTRVLPMEALIATLGSDAPATVPVNRQTEWLMRRLPLPVASVRGDVSGSSTPLR